MKNIDLFLLWSTTPPSIAQFTKGSFGKYIAIAVPAVAFFFLFFWVLQNALDQNQAAKAAVDQELLKTKAAMSDLQKNTPRKGKID